MTRLLPRSAVIALLSLTAAAAALAAPAPATYEPFAGPAQGVSPRVLSPRDLIAAGLGSGSIRHEIDRESVRERVHGSDIDANVLRYLKTHDPGITLGGTEIVYDTTPEGKWDPLAPVLGTNFQGMTQFGWIPYDAAMAVGPTNVLLMTNSQWGVYNKTTGAQQFLVQFDNWFGVNAGGGFDPKCFYDAVAGRWVIMCVEAQNPNAFIDISVSQTSDPLGAWYTYILDVTVNGSSESNTWMDFPHMGHDDNSIYVAGDQYRLSNNTFRYSKLRVLSKAQLYAGAAATWVDFFNMKNSDNSNAFAPSPAMSTSATTTGYMFNTRSGGGSSVTMWRITGGPSSPVLTRIDTEAVGTYSVPPDAAQKNTGTLIATGDCRTQDCVWQNGTLYTGWSERLNNASAIRYFSYNTSTLAKIRDVSLTASGLHYYYPGVAVDKNGNAYVSVCRSSSTEFASMYHTGMKTSETTLEASALIKAGVATNTSGRWGDYNAAAQDPSTSTNAWVCAGWANTGNAWAEWVGNDSPALLGQGVNGAPSVQTGSLSLMPADASHPAVRFTLTRGGPVTVELFAANGRLVRSVEYTGIAGDNTLVWDGLDARGVQAPAGPYLARVRASEGSGHATRILLNR